MLMKRILETPLIGCKWWKRRISNLWQRSERAPELFFQFVFTYGIMTMIVALSICIYFLSPYEPTQSTLISGSTSETQEATLKAITNIWSIIINSYMPTTITFVGVVLFSDGFISKHKLRGVLLLFLTVSLALAYIAFVSINGVDPTNDFQTGVLNFVRYLNIVLMVPAISLIPDVYTVVTGKGMKQHSDGQIYF